MNETNHEYLATLVMQSQAGDMSAFSEIYALTYNKVYNYARHYLHNSDTAQDAVQEIYILVLKNLKKLNNPMLFIAWLNQICFRACYDICKKKDSDYQVVDDTVLEQFYDERVFVNPEHHIEKNAERLMLQQAIDELPPLQRSIIIMRYFNNLKLSDISDAMDISLSSVKRYLESARNSLQTSFNRQGGVI